MSLQFTIADVFATTPFGGNQLAVFPDARGISDRAMQALAREFNFPESTFVFPPEDPGHTRRVRIFTPQTEVPFAGHPTVGTAAVLVERGLVDLEDGSAELVLEEGVGPIVVVVTRRGGTLMSRFTLDRGPETAPTRPSLSAAAAALSLPPAVVVDAWFASVGLPFCFIRLDTAAAVDRARLDHAAWAAHFASAWSPHLFFFAGEVADGGALHARMFAPAYGITEDPATGSACAALAGTLAEALPQRQGTFHWQIAQGVAMGRSSGIEASADKRDGRVVRIHVAGSTTIVAEGTITLAGELCPSC
jgi:trans-2,3-dihydro-3-hydroxyanthranilate isomerase